MKYASNAVPRRAPRNRAAFGRRRALLDAHRPLRLRRVVACLYSERGRARVARCDAIRPLRVCGRRSLAGVIAMTAAATSSPSPCSPPHPAGERRARSPAAAAPSRSTPDALEPLVERLGGVRSRAAAAAAAAATDADAALDAAAALGIRAVALADAPLSAALARDPDPPLGALGRWHRCGARSRPPVAIVGLARRVRRTGWRSPSGSATTSPRAGVSVVSGLARGVRRGGAPRRARGRRPTVAVLGSGADVVYPAEHAALTEPIAAAGAVVSECRPARRRAPATSRCGTGSSAASRGRSWSSRHPRRAGR